MVAIDGELQATTAPPTQVRTVEFRPVVEPLRHGSGDCGPERRSDDAGRV